MTQPQFETGVQNGALCLAIVSFFEYLFGSNRNQYSHIDWVRNMLADDEATFAPIQFINNRLCTYRVSAKKYAKAPQHYTRFIELVQSNTLNKLLIENGFDGDLPLPNLDFMTGANTLFTKQTKQNPVATIAPSEQSDYQSQCNELQAYLSLAKMENEHLSKILEETKSNFHLFQTDKSNTIEELQLAKIDAENHLGLLQIQLLELQNEQKLAAQKMEFDYQTKFANSQATMQKEFDSQFIEKTNQLKNVLNQEANTNLQIEKETIANILDSKNNEIENLQRDFAEIEKLNLQLQNDLLQNTKKTQDLGGWLRSKLTSANMFMVLTICVVFAFLPFTTLAISKYINIETSNSFAILGVGFLCFAIALIWDSSILVFAINGKHGLATIGSVFQFIFFAAKFDYLTKWGQLFFDFAIAAQIQEFIVISAVVLYSPILISQFTKLATINETK